MAHFSLISETHSTKTPIAVLFDFMSDFNNFKHLLPSDKIDTAAALTVTSLLSAIAFQSSINGDLPEIGYVIYVDKLFYISYFLIAVSMALSLWLFNLDLQSDNPANKEKSRKILLLARIFFPLIFISAVILFAL